MVLVLLAGLLAATAWLGAFVLGAALVWRGLRGRLVDDDPRCRRCGYNLVATPRRPGRCPECGATIYGLGTIRLGARKRRESLIIIGAAIMLLCLFPLGLAFVPISGNIAAAPNPGKTAPPAAAPLIAPAPVASAAQDPLFSLVEKLAAPTDPVEPHTHAEAEQRDASDVAADEEAPIATTGDSGPTWYTLRTINGCCPHCGCPVGTMSRSPRCPECGRNIAE